MMLSGKKILERLQGKYQNSMGIQPSLMYKDFEQNAIMQKSVRQLHS